MDDWEGDKANLPKTIFVSQYNRKSGVWPHKTMPRLHDYTFAGVYERSMKLSSKVHLCETQMVLQ